MSDPVERWFTKAETETLHMGENPSLGVIIEIPQDLYFTSKLFFFVSSRILYEYNIGSMGN